MTAQQMSPSADHQPDVPAGSAAGSRLFSDKRLMDNPEGDRRILKRALELADQRNRSAGAA